MSQVDILKQMSHFLYLRQRKLKQQSNPDFKLISEMNLLRKSMLTTGCCHGFSITYGINKQWEEILAAIEKWDGQESSLKSIPTLSSTTLSLVKEKKIHKVDLETLFEFAIDYATTAQATTEWRAEMPTDQSAFLKPGNRLTHSILEIALEEKKESKTDSIITVSSYYEAGGHLDLKRFKELIEPELEHIKKNLCIIENSNHSCNLSIDENGHFIFFDPNYPDNKARKFSTLETLYIEIWMRVGRDFKLLLPILENNKLSPEQKKPFAIFYEWIQDQKIRAELFQEKGLYVICRNFDNFEIIWNQMSIQEKEQYAPKLFHVALQNNDLGLCQVLLNKIQAILQSTQFDSIGIDMLSKIYVNKLIKPEQKDFIKDFLIKLNDPEKLYSFGLYLAFEYKPYIDDETCKDAVEYYQLAMQHGHKDAKPLLDEIFTDLKEFACSKNNPRSQFHLAYCYENGLGVEKDLKEATRLYTAAAAQGHIAAQIQMGSYLESKDPDKAIPYYLLAAEQGSVLAYVALADIYSSGDYAATHVDEAIRCYLLAAKEGDVSAKLKAANYLFEGKGNHAEQNLLQAFGLCEFVTYDDTASQEEKLMAYNKLGYAYMMGLGVKRNMQKAIFYYEYAADFLGDISANIILGDIYNHGDENIRDIKLAIYHYQLAANHGVAEAQYQLGLLFEQDNDIIRAQQYYKLAAAQNHEAAQHALGQYAELSPEKILATHSFIARSSNTQSAMHLEENQESLLKKSIKKVSG